MTDAEASHNGTLKRKLPPASRPALRGAYTRKRAFAACEVCRARKTKCDNQRPKCGSCMQLEATCTYPDPASDHASFDPASLAILDRLNYLIHLHELIPASQLHGTTDNEDFTHPNASSHGHADEDQSYLLRQPDGLDPIEPSTGHNSTPKSPENAHRDLPRVFHGSSEDILDWPVFQAKHDGQQIEELIFDPTSESHGSHPNHSVGHPNFRTSLEGMPADPRINSTIPRELREEDILDLVERFLANVHTKNPIFDSDTLRGIARSTMATGFGWDAQTCLVLMACALAAISTPFVRVPILDHGEKDSLDESSEYATAEAYYDAARKRIGMLTSTRLATECYFLAGVYEMYSLRPLRSSISFNRACVAFQALTWMRSENHLEQHRLEKAQTSRLYWSCLKSEHEIMVELRFPASGLTTLNYTQSFPSPPVAASTFQSHDPRSPDDIPTGFSNASASGLEPQLERAWYYYLADIAVRRILQRVFDTFYRTPDQAWLHQSIPNMIRAAEELDQQLTQWCLNLPDPVAFSEDVFAEEELSFHLQARNVEVRERIHRPFLFIAIHHSNVAAYEDLLAPLVRKHLLTCVQLIRHWNVRHRHHGTWLMVRQSFAAGLLLVAARRAGFNVISDEVFKDALRICLSTLQFWEREAPDLRASRLILEDVATDCLG